MKQLLKDLEEKHQVASDMQRKAQTELEKNYWFGVTMAYGDTIYELRRLLSEEKAFPS